MENYIVELIIAIGGGITGLIFLITKIGIFSSSEKLASTANESYTKLYTDLVKEIDRLRESIEELKTEYKQDILAFEEKQAILTEEVTLLKSKNMSMKNAAINTYNFINQKEITMDVHTIDQLKERLMNIILEGEY